MEEIYNNSRPRITGAMISKFVGKNVTILGTVDPSQVQQPVILQVCGIRDGIKCFCFVYS